VALLPPEDERLDNFVSIRVEEFLDLLLTMSGGRGSDVVLALSRICSTRANIHLDVNVSEKRVSRIACSPGRSLRLPQLVCAELLLRP